MYKQILNRDNSICGIAIMRLLDNATIPFDPDNTDYQTFKKEVLAGAELQDADGNVMTDASAYIGTLP
jgi:hypothetical protein